MHFVVVVWESGVGCRKQFRIGREEEGERRTTLAVSREKKTFYFRTVAFSFVGFAKVASEGESVGKLTAQVWEEELGRMKWSFGTNLKRGRCQFGESKISINLATPTPVNVANFCVSVVNAAKSHNFSGGVAYVGKGGEGARGMPIG